jgi:hypothetical protein
MKTFTSSLTMGCSEAAASCQLLIVIPRSLVSKFPEGVFVFRKEALQLIVERCVSLSDRAYHQFETED